MDEKNKEETTVHVQYAIGLLQNFFGTYQRTTHWNLVATAANLLPSSSICDNPALTIVHTHWSDHVIVWKSLCIQTAKARTCFLALCFTLVVVII